MECGFFGERKGSVAGEELSGCFIAGAADIKKCIVNEYFLDGHLPFCDGSGFVGADDGGLAQGFDDTHAVDDGVFLCHAVRAGCKGGDEHDRESFREGRYRECDDKDEDFDEKEGCEFGCAGEHDNAREDGSNEGEGCHVFGDGVDF